MRLFKRKRAEKTKELYIEKDDRWLRVKALNFFGHYSTSPDGQYILSWADTDQSGQRGGFRDSGHGSYVLAYEDQLILTGNMERPNDGRVANNGNFVINDWMFGEGLKGIFYAIDKNGTVLIRHVFKANLLNTGISPDGVFAVCQTCHSDTPDGNLLCLFDLCVGKMLWYINPETGWAQDYSFYIEQSVIHVQHEAFGEFRYNLKSGEFLDRDRWIEQRTKHGSGFDLLSIAEERIAQLAESSSEANIPEIIDLLKTALTRGLTNYPNQQAIIYRHLGELWERLGDKSTAIGNYEQAIKCNPNVGVKRRLNQLKQSLEK
ncbi:hypothetical protein ACFLXE_01855 [Chloroflexota bacterium]